MILCKLVLSITFIQYDFYQLIQTCITAPLLIDNTQKTVNWVGIGPINDKMHVPWLIVFLIRIRRYTSTVLHYFNTIYSTYTCKNSEFSITNQTSLLKCNFIIPFICCESLYMVCNSAVILNCCTNLRPHPRPYLQTMSRKIFPCNSLAHFFHTHVILYSVYINRFVSIIKKYIITIKCYTAETSCKSYLGKEFS